MIGISLLTFAPGHVGGSETYARGLLAALAADAELEYRVFLPPAAADAAAGLPVEIVPGAAGDTGPTRALGLAGLLVRPGPRRGLAAADALHYPLTVPLPSPPRPWALTLHDVQHLDLPGLFSAPTRAFRKLAYDGAARRADAVIVPTEFVRGRAVERLELEPERVRVVAHGIDHERFRPGPEEREPFLLYPAKGWPHKNHARLLEAFRLLRRERPGLRLVLTGGGVPAGEGVEQRGRVSLDELAGLYRRASALVFPSLYEGFGQPPLEAMACGCPVACSDAASLPEVVGDAARLFDPRSPEAIAAAVAEVLDDSERWRDRGIAHAARFSWERSAREHEAVYRELPA